VGRPLLHRVGPAQGLILILILPLSLTACQGEADASASASSSTGVIATASSTGETGETSDTHTHTDTDASSTGASSDEDPPFELERENIRLLPYAVRLSRLTLLLDRPAEDPIFAVMNARRFELGDYDFSQNINPDLTWSTTRMSHWIAALRPICSSAVMKERYPEFPLALPDLMRDAYGYSPTSAELEPFAGIFSEDEAEEDMQGASAGDEEAIPPDMLSDEARYETACIAVLSSLEFVSQ